MTVGADVAAAIAGALTCVGGVGGLSYCALNAPPRGLIAAWISYRHALDQTLQLVRVRVTASQLTLAQLIYSGCTLLAAARVGSWWGPALLVALGWCAPRWWLQRMRAERITRIEAQLDTWLLLLAHALKATPALGEAMSSTATLLGGPLGQELAVALREHRLGSPLNVAIAATATRVGSPVLSVAATTLEVARRSGGNLSQTLEVSAASLREMARLEGVVRTKTAEARSQAWVVSCVPVVFLLVLREMAPELIDVLFVSARGHVVLLVAGLMWLAAIASAVKILRVDI
jgi:tight adherence protein B